MSAMITIFSDSALVNTANDIADFNSAKYIISFVRTPAVFADLNNFLKSTMFEHSDCTYRIVFVHFDCQLLQNRKTVDCSTVVQ